MFHLASKVYITSDKLIDLNSDRVVISATSGFPTHSELDGILSGQLIAYSTSVSEMFTSRWNNLLSMINSLIHIVKQLNCLLSFMQTMNHLCILWLHGIK